MGLTKYFDLKLINISLRALSLSGRFLLLMYISKKFSIEQLGVFGLFNTSILIGIQILGFDYYSFSTREILSNSKHPQRVVLNQFYFHVMIYLILIPLFALAFSSYTFIPKRYLAFFIIILILEHIGAELYRLLLTLKASLLASISLFIRSSLWVFLLVLLFEAKFLSLQFEYILLSWLCGCLVAILGPARFILVHYKWREDDFGFNRSLMMKGLRISLPFFACTILLKALEYSNRYILDYFGSKAEVGVYFFFSNFAGVLSIGVFTLVTMVQFPRLIELSANENRTEYLSYLKSFKTDTLKYTVILIPIILVVILPIAFVLGKIEILKGYFLSYLIMVATNVLICFGYFTHYALYCNKSDIAILTSNAVGASVNLIFCYLLVPTYDVLGASLSTFFGFASVLIFQVVVLKRNE